MTTDNELLNLAARAVGAKPYSDGEWPGLCLSDNPDGTPSLVDSTGEKVRYWNSLDSSADAFDLMVRLSMVVDFEDEPLFAVAAEDTSELAVKQLRIPGSYSAARRVVTRAAAAVGKGMLTHDEFMRLFPQPEDMLREMKEAALAATPKRESGADVGFFPKGLTGVTIQWPKL